MYYFHNVLPNWSNVRFVQKIALFRSLIWSIWPNRMHYDPTIEQIQCIVLDIYIIRFISWHRSFWFYNFYLCIKRPQCYLNNLINVYNDMLLGLNVHVKSANSIMFFLGHIRWLNTASYLFFLFFSHTRYFIFSSRMYLNAKLIKILRLLRNARNMSPSVVPCPRKKFLNNSIIAIFYDWWLFKR